MTSLILIAAAAAATLAPAASVFVRYQGFAAAIERCERQSWDRVAEIRTSLSGSTIFPTTMSKWTARTAPQTGTMS